MHCRSQPQWRQSQPGNGWATTSAATTTYYQCVVGSRAAFTLPLLEQLVKIVTDGKCYCNCSVVKLILTVFLEAGLINQWTGTTHTVLQTEVTCATPLLPNCKLRLVQSESS